MIVTLKNIYVNATDKNGNQLLTKNGEPYWKVTLDTDKGKMSKLFYDEYLIPKWTKGSQANVEIKTNGDFINWDFPKTGNPYAAQPNNDAPPPIEPYAGAVSITQKHNPMETQYQAAKEVFESKPDDVQERIIRGMCFNNACALLAYRTDLQESNEQIAKRTKDLSLQLYKEMYDWLSLKN